MSRYWTRRTYPIRRVTEATKKMTDALFTEQVVKPGIGLLFANLPLLADEAKDTTTSSYDKTLGHEA